MAREPGEPMQRMLAAWCLYRPAGICDSLSAEALALAMTEQLIYAVLENDTMTTSSNSGRKLMTLSMYAQILMDGSIDLTAFVTSP